MEHWYVYYTVPAADVLAVANRVRAMFNALADAAPGAKLLQRADAANNEVTLMEVYEPVTDAALFAQALERAVHASGLVPGIAATRRIERFKDF